VRYGSWAYLQTMALSNESSIAVAKIGQPHRAVATDSCKITTFIRSALRAAFAVLSLAAISMAAEPPNAPSSVVRTDALMIEAVVPVKASPMVGPRSEVKPIDQKFVALSLISTGSTFADSYTTLFARQNWLAGKKGVCNVEVESAYLYGTHPTVGRAYAVASVKSVGSVAAAYYLRKHHNRFWSLPLFSNSVISLQGVTQNMIACN
jgi:hypothetical protein